MLLLWANELEVEAVMQLLVKLGEFPPQGGNLEKVRVLTTIAPEDAAEFLEKLKRAWPSLLPNELNLPDLPEVKESTPGEGESDQLNSPSPGASKEVHTAPSQTPTQLLEVALHSLTDSSAAPDVPVAAQNPAAKDPAAKDPVPKNPVAKIPVNQDSKKQTPADEAAADPPALPSTATNAVSPETAPELPAVPTEPSNEALLQRFFAQREKEQDATPTPINMSFAPDGSLVITSDDTAALDVLEELISQTAPPVHDYKVYKLKFADAYWVMDNIEDFFKEDKDDENRGYSPYYFYDYRPQQQTETRRRLSQRRKLKFIYDLDTNSILVQGADSRQLKTIEDLIAVYDVPEPTNSQSARVSMAYPIRYSKASIVATAIKDVYRDLLSSNDEALQNNNPEKKNCESRETTTYIFGDAGGGEPDRTQVRFKWKLSIGIDEASNTLLVSAQGENLMKIVGEMIRTLDEAAKPLSNVSIVHLNGNTNAARVREVLATLLTEGKSAPSSAAAKNANARQNGQNRPRG